MKEGDVLRKGNTIFRIKLIQINENENRQNEKNNNDIEINNTLMISWSANHSLELNNYDDINIAQKKITIKKNSTLYSEKNEKKDESQEKTEKSPKKIQFSK